MNKITVLIVTSGEDLWGVERLRLALSDAGFRVVGVDREEVQAALHNLQPVLVIANLSDEWVGDLEFCQKLVRLTPTPVVAIGSSAGENAVVQMFETLVDDYLARPVSTIELVARVRSILRRTQPGLLDRLPPPPAVALAEPGRTRFFELLRGLMHGLPQRHNP
jgi:DNA-binding response OmpR family regulator